MHRTRTGRLPRKRTRAQASTYTTTSCLADFECDLDDDHQEEALSSQSRYSSRLNFCRISTAIQTVLHDSALLPLIISYCPNDDKLGQLYRSCLVNSTWARTIKFSMNLWIEALHLDWAFPGILASLQQKYDDFSALSHSIPHWPPTPSAARACSNIG